MRLAKFISTNKESILEKWEEFARTIEPPALTMDIKALRNHATHILDAIVDDLDTPQTRSEQSAKSKGQAPREIEESYAETHATQRLRNGYDIGQLVSEYRALRASVLKLWASHTSIDAPTDADDITRFNEAIDQALYESVVQFANMATGSAENEKRRLDALLQAAPVGIVLTDAKGKLILSNPENRRLWGPFPLFESTAEYGEFKGWWADGSERHGRRVSAKEWPLTRSLAGEDAARDIVEIEPFGSSGKRRTVAIHAAPIRDAERAIIGSVVAQMDITSQVETEAALRESEAKFRTISDAMPQMVWSTLPDGFHDYYNRQWYEFTGVPKGSTDGEGWNAIFHPDDQAYAWELWEHSLATGEPYEILYRLRHHSGEYRWTLGRALPVLNESGKIIRWMGTCTDIHDQKLAEEELKNADRRKDEFLAMLAHELRNPLAPISTAAQLLKISCGAESATREYSDILIRQVRHMAELVDDLLDVSRVTRGLIELDKKDVDLKPIVNKAIEQAQPLIEERQHQLQILMTSSPAFVHGDRTRLVQVIVNLLTNAAKYTPRGGEICVSLEVRNAEVIICVKDNGNGIDPALLPYIFELFVQGKRTSDRAQGGLGLGLALVKNITTLHDGNVSVVNNSDKGSTFKIALPLLDDAGIRSAELPHDGISLKPSQPLSVMIVDDNLDAAQTLAALLEMANHDVTVMPSAESALRAAHMAPAQVFILDIGLPDMDGYALARELRATPETANALLIALTGYGQADDRASSRAAGFDHHFVKPVDLQQLAEVLSRVN